MTLVEGEIIDQIEVIGEGWWVGVGDEGHKSGLFPENYVVIIVTPDAEEEEAADAAPPRPRTPPPVNEGYTTVTLYEYLMTREKITSSPSYWKATTRSIPLASDEW
jgi:hypothetical protein